MESDRTNQPSRATGRRALLGAAVLGAGGAVLGPPGAAERGRHPDGRVTAAAA